MFFGVCFAFRNRLNALPASEMAWKAIVTISTVGGPPIMTGLPAGMAIKLEVGSSSVVPGLLPLRGGAGMPMEEHVSTGLPIRDWGAPSKRTVAEPMKISPSLPGSGGAKGPPRGMWGGRALTSVPAWAAGLPLTYTVVPMMGR